MNKVCGQYGIFSNIFKIKVVECAEEQNKRKKVLPDWKTDDSLKAMEA